MADFELTTTEVHLWDLFEAASRVPATLQTDWQENDAAKEETEIALQELNVTFLSTSEYIADILGDQVDGATIIDMLDHGKLTLVVGEGGFGYVLRVKMNDDKDKSNGLPNT